MTLKNAGRLKRKLSKMTPSLKKELSDNLRMGAFQIQAEARRSIQSSPPDPTRSYKSGRSQASHNASFPGNPPRTDTGNLVRNITVKGGGLKFNVGSRVNYGKYLEFGTQNIAARPWLYPAYKKVIKPLKKEIAKALNRELEKIGR